MPKIVTFLKRLKGRVRKHMDAVLLAMGGILIPLGFFAMAGEESLTILSWAGVAAANRDCGDTIT